MAAKRVCPATHCPKLIPAGTRYCPEHMREHEAKRGTKAERGYGREHQLLRIQWKTRIESGEIVHCAKCGGVIAGDFDLGHTNDRRGWTGPEHPSCNRSDGGKRAHLFQ